jgi:hypothetical protein
MLEKQRSLERSSEKVLLFTFWLFVERIDGFFFVTACEQGDAKRVIELLGKEKGEAYALVNVRQEGFCVCLFQKCKRILILKRERQLFIWQQVEDTWIVSLL